MKISEPLIPNVHWGQWSFVPSASHPMGGMEFQVVLMLIMLYLVVTGNRSIDSTGARSAVTA